MIQMAAADFLKELERTLVETPAALIPDVGRGAFADLGTPARAAVGAFWARHTLCGKTTSGNSRLVEYMKRAIDGLTQNHLADAIRALKSRLAIDERLADLHPELSRLGRRNKLIELSARLRDSGREVTVRVIREELGLPAVDTAGFRLPDSLSM